MKRCRHSHRMNVHLLFGIWESCSLGNSVIAGNQLFFVTKIDEESWINLATPINTKVLFTIASALQIPTFLWYVWRCHNQDPPIDIRYCVVLHHFGDRFSKSYWLFLIELKSKTTFLRFCFQSVFANIVVAFNPYLFPVSYQATELCSSQYLARSLLYKSVWHLVTN